MSEDSLNVRPRRYRFGTFVLDAQSLELRDGDRIMPLEPRPARILLRLVERAGDMVLRAELLALGWPRLPHAAGDSLNTCIRQIRGALEDDAKAPVWIETLRGRGYRFRGPVALDDGGRPRRRMWLAAPVVAALAALFMIITMRMTGIARSEDLLLPSAVRPGAGAALPVAARDALLKARYIAQHGGGWAEAVALMDSLVIRYPHVATVLAWRAEALLFLGRADEARQSADRALALDPRQSVAHRVSSSAHALRGDWRAAHASIVAALDTDPNDATTWLARAFLHTVRSEFTDAEQAMKRALLLDPLSPLVHGDIGLMSLYAGDYAEAARSCAESYALETRATWALDCLFDAQLLAGDTAGAARTARRLLDARVVTATGSSERLIQEVQRARITSLRSAAEAGQAQPYLLALAHVGAGNHEQALANLERAADMPGFGILTAAVDPRFASLRGDLRFRRIVERFGLRSGESVSSVSGEIRESP